MFQIGDKVKRTNKNNASGAKVGQEAVVTAVDNNSYPFIYVRYPGCLNDHMGAEGWDARNAKKVD